LQRFYVFDWTINIVLFWASASLLALQAYNIAFHKSIPNIRTAPAIRKKIISLLKQDYEARKEKPYTILDLGSGNGQLSREIAKALPQAKVIGIEITKHTYLWADWLRRREKLDNMEYKRMDFLDYNFSEASAVVMYTMPHLMRRIGDKLNAESKSGTLVLSNKFRIGNGWEPTESMRIKTLYLHQGGLYVYRKP
jgi:SAM-dependent methyltransferase